MIRISTIQELCICKADCTLLKQLQNVQVSDTTKDK